MSVTVYNNPPHWDDFDEKKNFYKILFRPSIPVQVREMNQLQTIIGNQIDKLTSHFFKDGSPVVGGDILLDREYSFVKVESTFNFNSIDYITDNYASELVGTLLTGQTTGVTARVLQAVQPENSDPLTLYVRYENSGTDTQTKTFQAEEILESDEATIRYAKVKPSSDTPTGLGTNFSVTEGYWFVNSALVYAPASNYILEKYNLNEISTRVVYEILEEVITEAEDSSLRDNVIGVRNSDGVSAYRQKISLILKLQDLDYDDRSIKKYIQLIEIDTSRVTKKARTEYSELADNLAQRTYDESGNYTVNSFGISPREFYNDGSNFGLNDITSSNVIELDNDLNTAVSIAQGKLSIGIETGKAYVFGYPVEVEDTFYIDVDKARDVAYKNSAAVSTRVGNYIRVNNITSIPDTVFYTTLNLRNSSNTTIGTARSRNLEFVSGSTYNLYLFDIKMNSGQTFGDVDNIQQTVGGGSAAFTCDVVSPSIIDSNLNSLVFKLPFTTVKTLRDSGNLVDFIYDTRDKFTGTVTAGSTTVTTGSSDIIFTNTSTSDWIVTRGSDGAIIVPDSIVINSPASSATLTFTGQDGETIYAIATNSKANLQEKTKTLNENVVVNIASPNTTRGGYDNLGIIDVLKLKSITEGGKDITSRYILDDGQRDNFYTQGRIQLKTDSTPPSGAIVVTLDHFTHSTGGDYFTVDSYSNIDYEDIPSYKGSSLRDIIDFRPTKDNTGTDFTSTGSSRSDMVKPNAVVRTDIQYYLPRIDKIYVNKYGEFGVIKGISGQPPVEPNNPKDAMVIYKLYINAYTFNEFDCIPELVDNSRSTMEDIRKISKRVSNLEYYTTLSLIEKETADLQLFDENGLERFKNGFIADGFFGHNLSDINNPEYSASIDKVKGHLRPSFFEDNLKLFYNSGSSSNIQKSGPLLTLPYTTVTEIRQPYATETISVNPYNVFSWAGSSILSPSSDEWKETKIRPDVIVNNEGIYNSMLGLIEEADVIGTFWNEWETNWTGVEVNKTRTVERLPRGWPIAITNTTTTTTTTNQARDGINRTVVSDTITNNLGDRIVEVNYIPFMRSRKVSFKANRLKPNTKLYAFFDNQNISNYVRQETFKDYTTEDTSGVKDYFGDTTHPDGATALITDASGNLEGSFIIPNNSSLKFKTGTRLFKLTDSVTNNNSDQTTFVETVYEARGIIETKENLVISTQVPRIERTDVTDTRVIVDRSIQERVRYIDPLAQTFVIDRPNGVFATSIDLFFEDKDDNIPVTVQIRVVENGYPTQRVVPFSEVTLQPSSVNISSNGATPTTFEFRSPVYLQQGIEYSIVILSNSDKYMAFVAKIGDNDVLDVETRVDKQPHNGVFFKSQNASTWTPDQTRDLKFNINRASFTSLTGSAIINNVTIPKRKLNTDPLIFTNGSNVIRVSHKNHGLFTGSQVTLEGIEATSGSLINNIPLSELNGVTKTISNVEYDSYTITTTTNSNATGRSGGSLILTTENKLINTFKPQVQEIILPNTDITYTTALKTGKSLASEETPYQDIAPFDVIVNENVTLDRLACIASEDNNSGSKSFTMTANFQSARENISPVIDLDRLSLITIANRIDRPSASIDTGFNTVSDFIDETEASGGSSIAKHFFKVVPLSEDADTLKIFMNVNRPSGSYIELYYRVGNSGEDLSDQNWIRAEPDFNIPFTDNESTFNEVTYTLDEDEIGETFTAYTFKIVMHSTNSSRVPTIKDFRGIGAT